MSWDQPPHETKDVAAPNGARLRLLYHGTVAYSTYGWVVELLDGKWPADEELCRLCHAFFYGQFGGAVEPLGPSSKRVLVQTD